MPVVGSGGTLGGRIGMRRVVICVLTLAIAGLVFGWSYRASAATIYDGPGFWAGGQIDTGGVAATVTISMMAYDIVVDPHDLRCQCIGPDYVGMTWHSNGPGGFTFPIQNKSVYLFPADPTQTYLAELIAPTTITIDSSIDTLLILAMANQSYGIASFSSRFFITFNEITPAVVRSPRLSHCSLQASD
jgi:hypothetical protein